MVFSANALSSSLGGVEFITSGSGFVGGGSTGLTIELLMVLIMLINLQELSNLVQQHYVLKNNNISLIIFVELKLMNLTFQRI